MASFDQFQNEFGHGFGSFAGPGGKQTEAYFEPSRTLFLGDLSFFCTEEDLCTLFQPYGPIAAVRVRRGVTGESLLHGFIAFHTPEATVHAVQDLDGKEFMGRNMR
jgi:RNA recognition motif-containing protein